MHLNNACRTGLTAKTAAYTAHRINDCVTAMRNVYRLTGTCDKTGSTGNTLFFFYKSFFQNSSSFCLYSVYRRSRRFTVTLSQKQIVTLSSHTGLMQLSNRNRQQQLIQAAGMYRTNSDAAHTGYTTVCVCFFRMLYRDQLMSKTQLIKPINH